MLSRLSTEALASLYDESQERMAPKKRERWLNKRLAEQVQFAYKNAPAIKEKFDKSGVSPSEEGGG
jgi:phenylacetate-coenzyme A ligase PaaK-like adenylate-forming protein